MIRRCALIALGALLLLPADGVGQVGEMEPLDVARIFARRYPEAPSMSYISGAAWSGALRLAELTGERSWREDALVDMRPFLEGERPATAEPRRLTGLGGLAAFADLGDPPAMALAREGADLMLPATVDEVVRFGTGWTDDMFMATSLLARVAHGTGDERYGSVIETLLTTYADRLQRPDGLFGHAESGPFAWGRGNGFAALGLAEALTYLPDDWPGREPVLEILVRQMRALVTLQTDDGSWRQVIDEPTSYRELTVTALTVAVMARGVRLGWLEADEFGAVIDRGWQAVLRRVGRDGSVRDVCASTPAGTTLAFYLERPVVTGGDDRGGALVLLVALEMEALRRSTVQER
ncbi:MAG TPA: glycoside hydrolase family 88 protein [Longimicrobiales bacterium]|nr:glycoside hydrolase family 88 protein [Longimicrobiales bacterium]